jgi:hypothetical protein
MSNLHFGRRGQVSWPGEALSSLPVLLPVSNAAPCVIGRGRVNELANSFVSSKNVGGNLMKVDCSFLEDSIAFSTPETWFVRFDPFPGRLGFFVTEGASPRFAARLS